MNLARIRTPEYALFYCRVDQGLDIHLGCDYIVEFDYGMDYSELIEFGDLQKKNENLRIPGFKIIRMADDHDREKIQGNLELSNAIRAEFIELLDKARIQAKVVHVRLSLNRRRIFIRYFARNPLNLQQLVRPLELNHHVQANLWQVGVRDETRLIGCIGRCGRVACCCSWMKHETSVNLKMAKKQGISLNPASLNGTCNRLKCCFKYENNVYSERDAKLPRMGSKVISKTDDKFEGVIINRDILRGRLVLRSSAGKVLTVDAADVKIRA